MENLIKKSIWVLVLAFFICASILTETISVYTSTFSTIQRSVIVAPSAEINIYLHKVDPVKGPAFTSNPTAIASGASGEIGNDLPTKGSNNEHTFAGWYTYDFVAKQYGATEYNAGDIIDANDLDSNNCLVLFEKYSGYIVDVKPNGNGSANLDDYGIQITINNGVGTITGVTDNVTDVVIPGTVTDQNGNEIVITHIDKPDDNKWENVTSIVFMEPSNIVKIAKDSMEGLDNIESIILPSSLVEIEESGLLCLENIKWVIIPESVMKLGQEAFKDVPKSCKVYCEASSKPSGWKNGWINSKCKVYWGGEWQLNANGVPVAK